MGFATNWNPAFLWANVGLELLFAAPRWWGGSYLLGASLRPVTVNARILLSDGEELESHSEIYVSSKILKSYPKKDRKKKSVQLRASHRKAMDELINEIRK